MTTHLVIAYPRFAPTDAGESVGALHRASLSAYDADDLHDQAIAFCDEILLEAGSPAVDYLIYRTAGVGAGVPVERGTVTVNQG